MTDITLLYLIKQLELAVRARLDEAVSPFGLTALQYTALTVLERRPGETSAELARNSFVRAQTMGQMITYLEEEGLVHRIVDPTNRRQSKIFLTTNGRSVVEQLRDPAAAIESDMVADLTPAQVAALRHSLRSCRLGLSGVHPR